MKIGEVKDMLAKLNILLKENDIKGIYDMMSSDFRKKVTLEHFKNLPKYEVFISPPLELIKLYNPDNEKTMIRVKYPHEKGFKETNILLVKEGNDIKIRNFLENL